MSVAQITQFAPGDDKINVTDVKKSVDAAM